MYRKPSVSLCFSYTSDIRAAAHDEAVDANKPAGSHPTPDLPVRGRLFFTKMKMAFSGGRESRFRIT